MDGGVFATITGSILGFLASFLPTLIEAYRQRGNPKPADPAENGPIIITDGDYDAESGNFQFTEASDLSQKKIAYIFLDMIRASVRPFLTYSFFVLFIYIKLVILYHALYVNNLPANQVLPLIWDEGTETLFAAVIAFWFGTRAVTKFRK